MTMFPELVSLLLFIARSLVDNADGVSVSVVETESTVTFRLQVAPDDLGKVIGKTGRTARALRVLLGQISLQHGRIFMLDIPH
jgi:predicted RNA-binding protein YlqC (UPF0109 family)